MFSFYHKIHSFCNNFVYDLRNRGSSVDFTKNQNNLTWEEETFKSSGPTPDSIGKIQLYTFVFTLIPINLRFAHLCQPSVSQSWVPIEWQQLACTLHFLGNQRGFQTSFKRLGHCCGTFVKELNSCMREQMLMCYVLCLPVWFLSLSLVS